MSRVRHVLRLTAAMAADGFRAAPGWMWATTVLTVIAGLSQALYPYGFKALTDALVDRDTSGVVVAVGLTGGLIAVLWAATNLDANVGFGLVDRVSVLVSARIATLVNRVAGIDHFERPDRLRELDLVDQNRDLLAAAPRTVLTTVSTTVRATVVVILLASVDPILVALPLFAIAPFVTEARATRIRERAEEAVAEDKRLGDELFLIASSADAAKELRIYGLGDEINARHRQATGRVAVATSRAAIAGGLVAAVGWTTFLAAFVTGLWIVIGRAVDGDVTPGQVVLTVVLTQQVRLILGVVVMAFGQLLKAVRTTERLTELEEALAAEPDRTADPPDALGDGIELTDLTFRHPGAGTPALDDVTLRLPAGSTVAIVGENGAGKTSLVKLLTGMYEPTAGAIRVDGTDLATIDLQRWRQRVSVGFQDHVAFELLAREAVGIGDLPRVDDEVAVEASLRRAGGADVIEALTDGLGTPLGRSFTSGQELSGGQWQKIALGRTMMRSQPLLLVLDEPTASLDAATEHALFERYRSAARRTADEVGGITILVSHRFSTVRDADLIVVLDAGRVAELGTHDELMAASATYAELFELQARAFR